MTGMKIISAIFIIALILILLPHVKNAVKNSPKGSTNDWLLGIGLIFGVGVFVFFLTQLL